MAFRISGGQFYPPLPSANRIGGAISLSVRPQSVLKLTRAQPGVVSFTSASYVANEGALLTFNVTRTSGASGSIAVDYSFSIQEGAPASGATGTIVWNSGESGPKSTTVQLTLVNATRNGTITLSNARSLSGGVSPAIGGTNPASLQIVNVTGAPVTDVTTFSVEGTGSQPMSFAYSFLAGDVPTGQVPMLTDNSNNILTGFQSNVLAVHPDGSVRHAMLHGVVAGGQTYKIRAGNPAVGTNKTVADFLAAVSGSIARVLFSAGVTATADLRDLLSSPTNRAVMTRNATANLRIVESGPNVLTVRVAQNVSTHLRVNFEVSWYGGTTYWVDVWVVNGYANLNGQGAAAYTGQVEINGALQGSPTVFSSPMHFNHSAWKPSRDGYWSGASGSLYVRHNTVYLRASKAIPNYGAFDTGPTTGHMDSIPKTCAPMDNCELRDNLDGTGAGQELALMPRWCANYIKSNADIRCYQNMLANDIGGAAYPVFLIDSVDGEMMTPNKYPNASYNEEVGFGSGAFNGQGFGVSAVNSHLPSVGYLSYLVTGRQFFMDMLHGWTSEANIWNSRDRNFTFNGRTVRKHYDSSIRAMGWQIRSNAQAAYITPDNHYLKGEFVDWVNGVATLVDGPHYGPGGSRRTAIGGMFCAEGNQQYRLFFHMFYHQSVAHAVADLGFTSWMPVAQYASILIAGLWGSTGEYPFEMMPRQDLKMGPTDQTAGPDTDVFYNTFTEVRVNNAIPAFESGTSQSIAFVDSVEQFSPTGVRCRTLRQEQNDGYFANALPCLSFLHALGIDGGFHCYMRSKFSTVQPDFRDAGQFDVRPREVALPAYIRNAAPLTWTQIPSTILPIPPNYPGAPGSRVYAWGTGNVKVLGSEYRIVKGSGHSDGSGNSIERLRLNADTPTWVIERQPTSPATPVNGGYFSDGRPNATHGYHDHHFYDGVNQVICHGGNGIAINGFSVANVDAYSPAIQDWLPQNTYANSQGAGGVGGAKAMSWASSCIYFVNSASNSAFSRWSRVAGGTTLLIKDQNEFGQIYKAACVDPIRGKFLHARAQGESTWFEYNIDTGNRVALNPQNTPGLTPTQQSAVNETSGSLEWDVRAARYLHRTSGQDVFIIDPVTKAASPLGVQGTPPPAAQNGLFGKGRYVPELDIWFEYPDHTGNAWFFKFASTQRPI